jgi:hypothetical protein
VTTFCVSVCSLFCLLLLLKYAVQYHVTPFFVALERVHKFNFVSSCNVTVQEDEVEQVCVGVIKHASQSRKGFVPYNRLKVNQDRLVSK